MLSTKDIGYLDDSEVLKRSVSDPQAFTEIVSRYQRLFVRKAAEITGNEDDASDVVQETFVRIYVAAKKFRNKAGASFKSWAYTILINQCYTFYKKHKKHALASIPIDAEFAEVLPDESAVRAQEESTLLDDAIRLISKLPVALRRVVELHFLQGRPQKEIALSEGLSPVAVRARIHRAKKELRKLAEVEV